ncbi:hypothetical protein B296_00019575 [Ensete ventricosum]|uniref:Molybdate-anion transporter n=1 Tax=Ensete ventricosum TaxID=4639 RepID=A0A427B1F7_ENSVE|nr:hypothetical protein B296_00019575 [Ensete ventricosum]
MEVFYYLVFGGLAAVAAVMELSKTSKDRIATSSAFNAFKNNYCLVYSLMMGSFTLPSDLASNLSVVDRTPETLTPGSESFFRLSRFRSFRTVLTLAQSTGNWTNLDLDLVFFQPVIGCRVLTSTISTVSMASTRETSGGSSLQDLDLLCCSGRLLDLWLTNGGTSLVDSFALFFPHQLLEFFTNNVGECFNRMQGSEEGLHHLLSCSDEVVVSLLQRGFDSQWLSVIFSKAIFLGNGLIAIVSGLFANLLADNLGFGPVAPFDAAACLLGIGMAIILSSWSENYGDPSNSKDLITQFKGAAAAIAADEIIALLGAIQSLFEGSMYTFVFLWTPALSPNDEDIPHGFIFATLMLSSMLGSSIASRLMARSALRVEFYMQIVFAVSAFTLLLPLISNVRLLLGCANLIVLLLSFFGLSVCDFNANAKQFFVAPSAVKGGSISFSGCVQLLGFCVFEACIGIFWPSMMKMRSQYIPEESRSTIMNFFRIPLNIFVCIILYNVSIKTLYSDIS